MSAPIAVGTSLALLLPLLLLMAGAALSAWLAWTTAVGLRRALQRGDGRPQVVLWAVALPVTTLFAAGTAYVVWSLISRLARWGGS